MAKSKSQRIGGAAFHELRKLTETRYPRQVERVLRWEPTLRAAFQAVSARDFGRLVTLPEGATSTETGNGTDRADRVLRAFDALLGSGATRFAMRQARERLSTGGEK